MKTFTRRRARLPRPTTPLPGPTLAVLAAVTALAAVLAGEAHAAAGELTLAEAMRRARSQAREVAAAEARAEAGAARIDQARAYRLPTVQLQEIWMTTDSPADVFGLQLQQERFSFPEFVTSDPNDPGFFDNSLTRLEVQLPLYTGGEIGTRIEQAELGAEAARKNAAWVADVAARAAAEAYIRLAQAREGVALLERSLDTVRAHAELAGAYVEQGMLVASELLRAQVEVSHLEDLFAEARGQARVAEANLAFRMGEAAALESWDLAPLPDPAPLEGGLADWLATAEERSDLEAARRQVAAARLEEQVANAARRPRFGLAVRQDFYDDLPLGAHGSSTSVMAQGALDLFAGGRHKAAAAAARAEAEAAAWEVERFTEGARLAVRDAWVGAESSRERWHTARAALKAAAEAERITEERFSKGVAKTLDLLDAATARREAETRELVARAQAHLATLRLAVEAGRTPESVLPGDAGSTPGSSPEDGSESER